MLLGSSTEALPPLDEDEDEEEEESSAADSEWVPSRCSCLIVFGSMAIEEEEKYFIFLSPYQETIQIIQRPIL